MLRCDAAVVFGMTTWPGGVWEPLESHQSIVGLRGGNAIQKLNSEHCTQEHVALPLDLLTTKIIINKPIPVTNITISAIYQISALSENSIIRNKTFKMFHYLLISPHNSHILFLLCYIFEKVSQFFLELYFPST